LCLKNKTVYNSYKINYLKVVFDMMTMCPFDPLDTAPLEV
jgi:hypothetical protein